MYNAQFTADLIKELLLKKNITGKQMSTDLGLGVNTLSNIRRGDVKSIETFNLIADYLNCSVDYLLGRTDSPEVTGGAYINGNNNGIQAVSRDNSKLTVNGAAAPNKDTLTEQLLRDVYGVDVQLIQGVTNDGRIVQSFCLVK